MKSSIELIRLIAVILITFTHTRNELESGPAYFIIEKLPTYGTAILSIISGYLYYTVSRKKGKLFKKKIKSLAIPYLIANVSVLLLVLIFNYIFEYNPLNRLSYDLSIITEGIFALNHPPINPPTYFIRDIFVIFSVIALFTQREYKALWVIVPFLLLGTLVLRLDVAFLFIIGSLYGRFEKYLQTRWVPIVSFIACLAIGIWAIEYLKFVIALCVFTIALDWQFKFYNTGRYSYLLHLYHSPIIVITYPILETFITHPILIIFVQIATALMSIYLFFLITKRIPGLKVLSGGR